MTMKKIAKNIKFEEALAELEQQVQLLIGLLYWKYAEGKKGIRYQECLSRIEGVLCEELSFVLDLSKDLLVERLEDCYRSMA